MLRALVVVVFGAVQRPAGVREVQAVVDFEDGAVDGPLPLGHVADGAEEFPRAGVRVGGRGWAAEDVHSVGAVAVVLVGGGDVDVPAAVEGVEFWGPKVGGVICVGRWGPVLVGV